MRTLAEQKELVACGLGEIPCDWKLENVNLVNVFSAEVYPTDIYLKGRRIVSIDPDAGLRALQVKDCGGRYAVPGLIDGHMHFESTMMSPEALADMVVPCGTTMLLADVMEIANVAGEAGIREMLESIAQLPYRMLIEVSSRVPTAPGLETTGAVLGPQEVDALLGWEKSVSLGELDSSKILITREDQYFEKILSALSRGKIVNGHAIGRLGQELNVYASAGISDDHECVTGRELAERLRVGMEVLIREGSTERNVDELIKYVVGHRLPTGNLMFCTDDKHIGDVRREGHINYNVNRAIALGLPPMKAIQMATIQTARHFRIEEDVGSLTPGRYADLLLTDSLTEIVPGEVWFEGRPVAQGGRLTVRPGRRVYPAWIKDTVHLLRPVTPETFALKAPGPGRDRAKVRVIELIDRQIINREIRCELPVRDGFVEGSTGDDVLKLAVVERYGKTGGTGIGFVKGFGLKQGALAYSMSHDHHNIVAVGTSDGDMAAAVNEVARLHGGLCAVRDGEVAASMELPIGGLMSEKSADEVETGLATLNAAAEALGCGLPAPFMTLSFISLPTVPELGLTDKGLVDVIAHKLIPTVL